MRMKIAIPSYNRPKVETINMLLPWCKKSDIYIFVNDEEQRKQYLLENVGINVITTNTKGIQQARNAILNFFPDDEQIIMLDDDIEGFYGMEFQGIKKVLKKVTGDEMIVFFYKAFEVCQKNGAKLWGIYPVNNAYFMNNKISNNGFIIGSACGIINNKLRYDEDLKLKEDYDYTLKNIIEYKKVIRFDGVTIKAKHYTNAGGCVEQRKENTNLESECCRKLLFKYPTMVRLNSKRDNEIIITV